MGARSVRGALLAEARAGGRRLSGTDATALPRIIADLAERGADADDVRRRAERLRAQRADGLVPLTVLARLWDRLADPG